MESLDKEFNREDSYEEYVFIERRKYGACFECMND